MNQRRSCGLMDRDKGTKVTIKVAIIHLNHNLNQQSIQRCMDQRRSCGPMDRASDYGSGDCRFESCQDQTFLLRYLQLCLVATFGLKDFDADQSFLKIQLYHELQ